MTAPRDAAHRICIGMRGRSTARALHIKRPRRNLRRGRLSYILVQRPWYADAMVYAMVPMPYSKGSSMYTGRL